jgi:hypothetical protein
LRGAFDGAARERRASLGRGRANRPVSEENRLRPAGLDIWVRTTEKIARQSLSFDISLLVF